jgi:hypothetical protein
MSKIKRIRLAGLLLILAACKPLPVVVEPTPQTIRLDVSPATSWILPAVDACVRETGGIDLTVREVAARAIDPETADLLILSGRDEPASGSAFEIGEVQAAIIVHPDNPLAELSDQDVADLFSGRVRQWSQLESSLPEEDVRVWLPMPEDEIWNALVVNALMGEEPSRFASIAPGPQAMRAAVAADPYAIGFLPAAYLDQTIKAVSTPLEIRIPILAISKSQPEGVTRDFLLCLQESIKK